MGTREGRDSSRGGDQWYLGEGRHAGHGQGTGTSTHQAHGILRALRGAQGSAGRNRLGMVTEGAAGSGQGGLRWADAAVIREGVVQAPESGDGPNDRAGSTVGPWC